ncbi:MAG: flagellin [Candidatus Eisenbacteria bacterium]
MANIDLTRTRSNIQSLTILQSLRDVNNQLATHQLRLGTGKRINSAGDDPAGLTIATKLNSRYRVLGALYDNVGQAKNLLNVAEGGLLNVNDILVTMQEKIMMSASDTLGTAERQAITQQLIQMVAEIDDIATQTEFNGVKLLNSSTGLNFQTGPDSQTTWTTAIYTPTALGMTALAALTPTDVIDSTNYTTYIAEIDAAMGTVSQGLTELGSLVNRFTAKEDMISVARLNTEAAYSRIYNADMALEQLEATKYQILQQTSMMMLAQANVNAASVLTLFGS